MVTCKVLLILKFLKFFRTRPILNFFVGLAFEMLKKKKKKLSQMEINDMLSYKLELDFISKYLLTIISKIHACTHSHTLKRTNIKFRFTIFILKNTHTTLGV